MENEILKWLEENKNEDNICFTKRIIPTELKVYGIKIPVLRKKASMLIKDDFRSFLNNKLEDSLELLLLKAYVIAGGKMSIEERMAYLDWFVPKLSDWAVTDGLISSLKCFKKEPTIWYQYLMKYQSSQKEFEIRFLFVSLMTYYMKEEYISLGIELLKTCCIDKYYSKMAVAWYLATMTSFFPERVFQILEEDFLSYDIVLMTINKIRQSYRVSNEIKEKVLIFKK